MNKRIIKKELKRNKIQVINIKENDVVVCQFNSVKNFDQMSKTYEALKRTFPDNKILLVNNDSNLSIIKKGDK